MLYLDASCSNFFTIRKNRLLREKRKKKSFTRSRILLTLYDVTSQTSGMICFHLLFEFTTLKALIVRDRVTLHTIPEITLCYSPFKLFFDHSTSWFDLPEGDLSNITLLSIVKTSTYYIVVGDGTTVRIIFVGNFASARTIRLVHFFIDEWTL